MARKPTERSIAIDSIVEEMVKKKTEEAVLKEEAEKTFEELKKASKNFISELGEASENFKKQELIEKIANIGDLYFSMRHDSDYTRKVLASQHKFENALNKFLHRNIYLTYVDDDGNLVAYDEGAMEKIYSGAYGNEGRGNINPEILKDIINTDEIVNNINEKLRESANNRNRVYLKAISRWEKNNKEGEMEYSPSINTFYWRLYDKDHVTGHTNAIKTLGVIAEGYADAVINEEEDISNDSIELSLKNLWENYIEKDSTSAIIKGDVVLKADSSIQFAIKEGKFSTAMIGQYIKLAHNITKINKTVFMQDFKLALPKLLSIGKTSKNIIDILEGEANDISFKLVKSILSGKKLNSKGWIDAVDIMRI